MTSAKVRAALEKADEVFRVAFDGAPGSMSPNFTELEAARAVREALASMEGEPDEPKCETCGGAAPYIIPCPECSNPDQPAFTDREHWLISQAITLLDENLRRFRGYELSFAKRSSHRWEFAEAFAARGVRDPGQFDGETRYVHGPNHAKQEEIANEIFRIARMDDLPLNERINLEKLGERVDGLHYPSRSLPRGLSEGDRDWLLTLADNLEDWCEQDLTARPARTAFAARLRSIANGGKP